MSSEAVIFKATGRRKEAIARVRMVPGEGKVVVNKRSFEDYFARETDRIIVNQPFEATNTRNKYDVTALVDGGGLTGQAGALRHGISRALAGIDTEFHHILRKGGFLTRDPRTKERKKYGLKGARKRFQWTKR
ncbi:MAG: 30S ribosomal protein S9 [Candidatus Omnitrophica bacterium]|nr:30S ribosomal protein S9 [Candidatus Omnitrophota bacterium]MDD5575036.1 30S ribosomal protein S9 [Candidatus Omnitrophota bacterium]